MEQELYELPEGWDWLFLREFAYIKGGKRLPKGEQLLDIKTAYPYVRVSDFNEKGSIDIDNLKYLSPSAYQQIKNYTISSEDLYISIAGTIGKTGFLPYCLKQANLTENAAKIVLKYKNKQKLKYIYYFTLSHHFLQQINISTKTVAQPKLALVRLANIKIPLPSLSEQQRITNKLDGMLGRIDQAITLLQENLDAQDALFASLLQQAFDPLGRSGSKNENLYELPAGWEWKKLSEICTVVSGTTPKTSVSEYWDGQFNWVTPAELNDSTIIVFETKRKITEKLFMNVP